MHGIAMIILPTNNYKQLKIKWRYRKLIVWKNLRNLYMALHFGGALQLLVTIPITKITCKKLPAKTLKIM